MFRPTASRAMTSASIPTWSWNWPSPARGSTAATTAAAASLGHQPTRSLARCTEPSQDGRYSRRCACRATHSSDPTCGPAGGGESRLTGSHLLELGLAEQPAGPHQHHDDEQQEYQQVAVGRGDVAGDEGLRQADQQAAEHRTGDRPDAADHRGGERLEAGDEADRARHLVEQQPSHDPGHAGQRGAEEERHRDREVHVDAEHLGGLPVGGHRPHLPAQLGPVDYLLQPRHQDQAHDQHQDLDRVDGDRADRDSRVGVDEVGRVVDAVLRTEEQERRALQEERDADGGDQRRYPRGVPQRPVREPLDRHPQAAHQAGRQREHDDQQQRHGDRQRGRPAEPLDHEETDVGPDHVQVPMGEVEQLEHPVDHREPECYQRVQRARGETVHQFLEEEGHAPDPACLLAVRPPRVARRLVACAPPRAVRFADVPPGQPGISWYLPAESILKRKNLPLVRSPCASNLIGCPRIESGSSVCLIAASTLARLGVWPDLQTEAIASSITWVAANTGGPNVPKAPYFAFAAAAMALSEAIAVMSGPNDDTYEPAIENVPGEKSPSVPKITAFLCCWARFRPNCWALAATCHGSTTTEVDGVTLADRKSTRLNSSH